MAVEVAPGRGTLPARDERRLTHKNEQYKPTVSAIKVEVYYSLSQIVKVIKSNPKKT
jgi:hypothetical protein